MLDQDTLELPDYRHQTAEVEAYFRALRQRDVVLSVEALGREFETGSEVFTALHDINFKVRKREFISVIGPSGCGKSTIARLVAGLDEPSSGVIRLDGHPVLEPGADRGMVFQGYTLFPWLTVKKNVQFGLRMKGEKRTKAESDAMHWLELVGLRDFADHYPDELSGGMKQRVAIARALANQPRILLMDEPFGALDAQSRASMQGHLLEIWSSVDVTIMFITHDLDEAVYLSDRIVVLGAKPGHIQEIIEVPVARPRSPRQFLTGHFLATKQRLEELIHPQNASAA